MSAELGRSALDLSKMQPGDEIVLSQSDLARMSHHDLRAFEAEMKRLVEKGVKLTRWCDVGTGAWHVRCE